MPSTPTDTLCSRLPQPEAQTRPQMRPHGDWQISVPDFRQKQCPTCPGVHAGFHRLLMACATREARIRL